MPLPSASSGFDDMASMPAPIALPVRLTPVDTTAPVTEMAAPAVALATGASWVCYFRALQIGEASKVAPVDKLSLVLVALFAFIFLGERPAPREWLGIALVATGVLVLAIKH